MRPSLVADFVDGFAVDQFAFAPPARDARARVAALRRRVEPRAARASPEAAARAAAVLREWSSEGRDLLDPHVELADSASGAPLALAVYRRWPHDWRVYERFNGNYRYVCSSSTRPTKRLLNQIFYRELLPPDEEQST